MASKDAENRRATVGYGSTYRRGRSQDPADNASLKAVLNGQLWMVKPDKQAQAANPCIWMQAGVVDFKNCNNFYDCTTCKYDAGMKKKVEKGAATGWRDAMRRRPGLERVCRHTLTNRIEERVCAYDYACHKCDFDQFFEDVWAPKTASRPDEMHDVKGFAVPTGYYFNDGHSWARIESGGYIRIGMDDFALKLFGRADAYELPVIGKELSQGRPGWGFKRSAQEAEALSPVNGVIVEVNGDLREKPAMANAGPYEAGWMMLVRTPDIKGTLANLMTDADSIGWLNQEVGQLEGMIEEVAGPLAADGGTLGEDIYGNLPGLDWGNLRRAFLKS
ncbi:conserved hypothetical protein [uncultured Desulfatiglans sp.]|nr:conserved hypothetical protein [uncultured Desulfatiglans sp.]